MSVSSKSTQCSLTSKSDANAKMGDFLPKSMFFKEIWVKNRPFSLFFGKIALNLQSYENEQKVKKKWKQTISWLAGSESAWNWIG